MSTVHDKMSSRKAKKQCTIEIMTLLTQLPYYNCKDLTSAHSQFNSLTDDNRPSRKSLDSLSLYDLSVFQPNSLDKDIDPESPILVIKPFGLNFICLTIRNLYVVLLIGNTIMLMSFWNTCQIFLSVNAVKI